MLDRLSEQNRWYRDFTLEALSRAVRETIACFPVYRTYLAPGQPVTDGRTGRLSNTRLPRRKRRNPAMEESIFNFLRDVLLFRFPPNLDAKARAEHTNFVLKFQQATGPIMAKGLEDTGLLHLQPAGGVERSGRRAAKVRIKRCGISRAEYWSTAQLAGVVAGHVDT
jgi:(1->4)-alpha-D-glucan 1-alpha-D-glucosylmutase